MSARLTKFSALGAMRGNTRGGFSGGRGRGGGGFTRVGEEVVVLEDEEDPAAVEEVAGEAVFEQSLSLPTSLLPLYLPYVQYLTYGL